MLRRSILLLESCNLWFVAPILCLSISCTSNTASNNSGETDELAEQELLLPSDLSSTRWVVLETSDAQGTVRIPRDRINYVLVFRDDTIYEHWIICQPFTGFYEYDSSLLAITDAGTSGAADCPVAGSVLDDNLIIFLENFYVNRQLVVEFENNKLILRGVDNSFVRYEQCIDDCFVGI